MKKEFIKMSNAERIIERVRHELKFRTATVVEAEQISPLMMRVKLQSEDFAGFVSAAYDDHVKVFFPEAGEGFVAPTRGDNGLVFPDGKRPPARDYTPRYFDAENNALTIDFVLHGDGPAGSWAADAKVGDVIGIGGPRGSFVVRGEYDYYLLIGDETALPAIGRRLEELPKEAQVIALIEVATDAEQQKIDAPQNARIIWITRNGEPIGQPNLLLDAVKSLKLPEGDGYIFVAGEAAMSKAVRTYFVDEHQHNPDWIKAAAYWRMGDEDFDDGHEH